MQKLRPKIAQDKPVDDDTEFDIPTEYPWHTATFNKSKKPKKTQSGINLVPISFNPTVLQKSSFWCSPISILRQKPVISRGTFEYLEKIGEGVFGDIY